MGQYVTNIKKAGKVVATIALVMKILVFVAIGFVALSLILMLAMPRNLINFEVQQQARLEVNFEGFGEEFGEEERNAIADSVSRALDINIEGAHVSTEDNKVVIGGIEGYSTIDMTYIIVMLLTALLKLALIVTTLFFVEAIAKAFRDSDSPFSDKVIASIRRFGFALIPWAVFDSIVNSISGTIYNGMLYLTVKINLPTVAVILLVFGLAYIFKYAATIEAQVKAVDDVNNTDDGNVTDNGNDNADGTDE